MPVNRVEVPRWYVVIDDVRRLLRSRHIYGVCSGPFNSLCREVDAAFPAVLPRETNTQEAVDDIIDRVIEKWLRAGRLTVTDHPEEASDHA